MPAPHRPSAERSSLLLKPHSILYPPIPRHSARGTEDTLDELHAGVDTVWKPVHGTFDCSDSLLTLRYFSMQSLQLRLGQLMQGRGALHSPEVSLFLRGRFDHVYVTTPAYLRMAANTVQMLGDPQQQPLFFDVAAQRMVIDVSRCFVPQSSQLAADTVRGLVSISESNSFKRFVERLWAELEPDWSPGLATLAVDVLHDTARCITRHVLKEPELSLTMPAQRLADEVGARRVAQALLTGAAWETKATVEAFAALWRQGLSSTPTR
ncbi:hypothetical protein [Hydrogenophaga soli]